MKNKNPETRLTPEEAHEDIERFNKAAEAEGMPKMNEYDNLEDVKAAEELLKEGEEYKPVEHRIENEEVKKEPGEKAEQKEGQRKAIALSEFAKGAVSYRSELDTELNEALRYVEEALSFGYYEDVDLKDVHKLIYGR